MTAEKHDIPAVYTDYARLLAETDAEAYESVLTAQPYLRGEHLDIEEGHLYVDVMQLPDAIGGLRASSPNGTGVVTGARSRHGRIWHSSF